MDKKVVIDGATLECDLGSEKSILKVPKSHGVTVKGKNQANISDNKVNENILDFKRCKRMGVCNPMIVMKWLKGNKELIIDGEYALMDDCIVSCVQGGVIRITNCGQD